jgi:predicted membrane protein
MTEALKLDHTFGSIKRAGPWSVPERMDLRQRMGSTALDRTELTFTGTHTELVVDMIGGSVEIRVPVDMHVTSALSTTLASYQDHRSDNPQTSGHTLAISGRAIWGSVEVRGPTRTSGKRG